MDVSLVVWREDPSSPSISSPFGSSFLGKSRVFAASQSHVQTYLKYYVPILSHTTQTPKRYMIFCGGFCRNLSSLTCFDFTSPKFWWVPAHGGSDRQELWQLYWEDASCYWAAMEAQWDGGSVLIGTEFMAIHDWYIVVWYDVYIYIYLEPLLVQNYRLILKLK